MSQYVRHFLEEPCVGYGQAATTTPAGFSPVYLDAGTLGAPSFPLHVQHGNNGSSPGLTPPYTKHLGDRYLDYRFDAAGAVGGHLSMFGWDVVNADAGRADCEILARFHADNGAGRSTGGPFRIGVRCSGTPGSWTGYFAEWDATVKKPTIVTALASVETPVQGAVVALTNLDVVWMRFQVRGTNLKLKTWGGEITDEPVAWSVTTVDANISAAGKISWGGKILFGGVGIAMTFLSVGTGADSAPNPPVTWANYLAFLALQDAYRCVLFEADPLGQDAFGNALTARVCGATWPFVSKPMDQPYSNICYEEILALPPKIKRRMSDVLRGRTTLSYGDMEVTDEVSNDDLTSRLSAWFAWNWDGRQIRLLLGHPTWRRVDFKTVFLGAVQDIYRASYGRIGFKLRGPEALLQNPVSTTVIGGAGPNALALTPIALAWYFNAEPPLYDQASLTYQVFKPTGINGMASFANSPPDVRIAGASQTQALRSISAVNAGTDTITFDANHGGLAGGTILFDTTNPLPLPLVGNVKYYLKTVPAPNQVTLSATAGGATIDITTATAGATAVIRNVDYDDTTGRIQLLVDPQSSRMTVDMLVNSAGGLVAQP